jgi:hypothetical protein
MGNVFDITMMHILLGKYHQNQIIMYDTVLVKVSHILQIVCNISFSCNPQGNLVFVLFPYHLVCPSVCHKNLLTAYVEYSLSKRLETLYEASFPHCRYLHTTQYIERRRYDIWLYVVGEARKLAQCECVRTNPDTVSWFQWTLGPGTTG